MIFPQQAVKGLPHTSTCGPCWCVYCCTDSYVQLALSTWCSAEQNQSSS